MTYFLSEILAVRRDQICVQILYQSLDIDELRLGHSQFDEQLMSGELGVDWCRSLARCWPRRFSVFESVLHGFRFSPLSLEQLGYPTIEWRGRGGKSIPVGFLPTQGVEVVDRVGDSAQAAVDLLAPAEARRLGLSELWRVERPFRSELLALDRVFTSSACS